jgi:hypothetical protein
MTRCHCGLLNLQCSGLAPPTPCQSPGARTCTLQDSRPCWPLLGISTVPHSPGGLNAECTDGRVWAFAQEPRHCLREPPLNYSLHGQHIWGPRGLRLHQLVTERSNAASEERLRSGHAVGVVTNLSSSFRGRISGTRNPEIGVERSLDSGFCPRGHPRRDGVWPTARSLAELPGPRPS